MTNITGIMGGERVDTTKSYRNLKTSLSGVFFCPLKITGIESRSNRQARGLLSFKCFLQC